MWGPRARTVAEAVTVAVVPHFARVPHVARIAVAVVQAVPVDAVCNGAKPPCRESARAERHDREPVTALGGGEQQPVPASQNPWPLQSFLSAQSAPVKQASHWQVPLPQGHSPLPVQANRGWEEGQGMEPRFW